MHTHTHAYTYTHTHTRTYTHIHTRAPVFSLSGPDNIALQALCLHQLADEDGSPRSETVDDDGYNGCNGEGTHEEGHYCCKVHKGKVDCPAGGGDCGGGGGEGGGAGRGAGAGSGGEAGVVEAVGMQKLRRTLVSLSSLDSVQRSLVDGGGSGGGNGSGGGGGNAHSWGSISRS